jgi:hypothetical protein
MEKMRFASKKGMFIKLALLVSLLVPILLLILKTEMLLQKPAAIGVLLLPSTFFAWIYLDTSYSIIDKTLFYRSGFLKGKLNVVRIKQIIKGYTAWSGVRPATATKGLLIVADGGDEVYISPEKPDVFIDQVKRINERVEFKNNK